MKNMKIKLMLSVMIICLLLVTPFVSIKAENPFITRTVNRFGELVETQDGYESYLKIKNIDTGSGNYIMSNPNDIYIDKDDYSYIADTGNKKILVLDNDNKYFLSFGEEDLFKPTGVFVRDNIIYVCDYGTPDDVNSGKVVLYEINKTTKTVTLLEKRYCPTSKILEINGFIYRPEKISVDTNLTMYVVCEGSTNGILTINKENRFMSYFAPNNVSTSLKDRLINFIYGENENVLLKDVLPTPPYNVHIDDSGYIYTVTQTVTKNDLGDTLKKVNISGENFYPATMLASSEFVAAWSGNCGNVYAATKDGYIYEYDIEGNVLFIFAGKSTSIDQLGLFKAISSIAVASNENLYILDPNDNSIQLFKPTLYTNTVHKALALYNSGKYNESKQLWEEALVYNSMLDIAHKGIGFAHFMNAEYEEALVEFKLANSKEQYSEAYWEIRNIWFSNNIGLIFGIVVGIILLITVLSFLQKKFSILNPIKEKMKKLKEIKFFKDFSLFTMMLRHPFDSTYYIKTNKKLGYYNGVLILLVVFVLYILSITNTGFIFNNVIIEKTILLKEAFKIIIPIILFVVANYLASSLLEGEGTFKAIFLTTMACFMPVIVLFPFIIIISNFLTFNESFIYYFGITIMIAWAGVYLLIVNKELHNYSFKRMILNLIMTILLMLVLLIVVILVYLMVAQVVDFIKDIFSEVIFHD